MSKRITATDTILKALRGRKTGLTAVEIGTKTEIKHVETYISHMAKKGLLTVVGTKKAASGRNHKLWLPTSAIVA